MQALLKAFWDIALLRRDPGHLPDSGTLVGVCALAYAAMSAVQSWMLTGSDRLFARTLADLALLVLLAWLLLAATGRSNRLRQTLGAVLGTGALLSPLVILLLALRGPAEANHGIALVVWAGSVAVILWYTFILGHIVRSALDTGWFTGVAIAITYVVASAALLTRIFPESG
jgi:hypothetical protein